MNIQEKTDKPINGYREVIGDSMRYVVRGLRFGKSVRKGNDK